MNNEFVKLNELLIACERYDIKSRNRSSVSNNYCLRFYTYVVLLN